MRFVKSKKASVSKTQAIGNMIPAPTALDIERYTIMTGLDKKLSLEELLYFKEMALVHQLNPYFKEIHCYVNGEGEFRKVSIVTGYETYIRKAEASGLLLDWYIKEAEPGTPIEEYWATLEVWRKDRSHVQEWTVYYSEAVQMIDGKPNAIWRKQPRMMVKKVTMSQGFRLFFETILHGMPYTSQEIPSFEPAEVQKFKEPKVKVKSKTLKELVDGVEPEETINEDWITPLVNHKPTPMKIEAVEDEPEQEAVKEEPVTPVSLRDDILKVLNNSNMTGTVKATIATSTFKAFSGSDIKSLERIKRETVVNPGALAKALKQEGRKS